jgi:CheY-like chemotaxis protein
MSSSQRSDPLSVLVVDDEAMIAMLLETTLQDLGCSVVGPTARVAPTLRLIEANGAIDGAFLDINLRDEMVYPVADALELRQVPFVFLTGYAKHGIDARYKAIPALTKPFSAEIVASTVKGFAARRQARK